MLLKIYGLRIMIIIYFKIINLTKPGFTNKKFYMLLHKIAKCYISFPPLLPIEISGQKNGKN